MSEKELYDLLSSIQVGSTTINVFYDHFEATPTQPYIQPPFILYRVEEVSTIKADDKVHHQENDYIVDLITEAKNTSLETQIETLFNDNHLPYDKEISYIQNERIYQTRYFM